MFKYYIYKFGQFCVNRLSLRNAYRLATFVSDLHYFFSFRDRRSVKRNLRAILPEEPEKNFPPMVREVFRNFGKYLVEFFRMANELDEQFVRERIKLKNFEVLDKALERGKGVIILTAHVGNWELGAVLLSFLGYPPMAVALSHKERPVNDLFNKQREAHGATVIPSHLAVRKCLEALTDNRLIALVADRVFSAHGEVLNFLGRKTLMPKGAAIFAAKTGAAIIPTFLMREEDDTFTFSMGDPIYSPEATVNGWVERGTLEAIMNQYIPLLEDKIRQYPTQWLMFREFGVHNT